MATIESHAAVDVGVPAARAFGYIADAANNPEWQGGMRDCRWLGDEPPIAVGSRYRQRARFMGRDVHSVFEVVEYKAAESMGEGDAAVIAARTLGVDEGGVKGGFPITFRRTVTATGQDTCRVETLVTGDPGWFFGIAGGLMAGMVRRSIRGDYERLKTVLEASR